MAHFLAGLLRGGIEGQGVVRPVRLGERRSRIGAIDRAGGRQEKVRRRLMACDLHHVEGPHQIGINIGAGVLQAVANPGLGGEVDDHTRPERLNGRVKGGGVLKHQVHGGEARTALKDSLATAFQRHIVIGREAIDPQHLVSVGEQTSRQMEADEARRTGHENPQTRGAFRPVHGVTPYHPKAGTV